MSLFGGLRSIVTNVRTKEAELLNEVVDSSESLKGGNYEPREIEKWLIEKMKPSMDKIRIHIGREISR